MKRKNLLIILSLATGFVLTHMAVKAQGILPTIIFHIGINLLGQVIIPMCMRYV